MPFTLNMPKLSPTMEMGVIAKWHVKEGDFVDADQLLMEVATDKATVEHNNLDPGYIKKILVKEGDEVAVNTPLAILTEEEEESIEGFEVNTPAAAAPAPAEEKTEVVEEAAPVEATGERAFASPLARIVAKERGVDLSQVAGSGPRGRIMSRDLGKKAKRKTPIAAPSGDFVEEPLTQMRKVIATRLQQAKETIPHFYAVQKVDVTRLLELRQELKEVGVKLTINDFILKGCAMALKDHPEVNSGFNEANQTILRFQNIDISIAVDIEDGLITPIVRQADLKPISDISDEVKDLASRAKQGKLKLEEFQGGSFTLSNLGMYGITEFSAIINPPQAAILAVGGLEKQLQLVEGEITERSLMAITVSVDHRVVDGAVAAQFLQTLRRYLEAPTLLLI